MIPASEAFERLREGNKRFASGNANTRLSNSQARRAELIDAQAPFAVIVACSDSRVPVELLFNQGLGDLFVIRVAGNIVAPSQIGSVEFAASNLGTRLVVVLGHSNCGAVDATLKELSQEQETRSPNLQSIVNRIRPALEVLDNPSLRDAVAANVRNSVEQLRHGSDILEKLIDSGDLTVIGAEYSIESGLVEFFDD
ncbi:MAG: carbonic anhydrase [Gammaproteobacteria bacterium]|jgi:carbonic anhydrase|nr:carbonic anhydrase [Gammaproteobacteria bacterium]